MAERSDQELISACLDGDSRAYGLLVMRYQLPMYRTALAIVKDPDTARDIIQNGFIKTWEKLQSYNSEHRFYSWLYRIIINESLNHVRKNSKMELWKETGTDERTPFSIMAEKEEHQELYNAVALLDKDHRLVIQLRHFEELSYQEIADVLEIDENKVKSRLYSARMKLRELMVKGRTA